MASEQSQHDELELAEQLSIYGGRVLAVAAEMPEDWVGSYIRDQLFRAATSPGAHYAEARSAQSHSDFTHKISMAAKEARESLYWLRVAEQSGLVDRDVDDLLELGDRLVGWLHSSMRTARMNESG